MQEYLNSTDVERLCQAIIVQAAKDYRGALLKLKKYPSRQDIMDIKQEVEVFFRSGWYEQLTDVDGEYLIRKLQEEVK